ncbi:hypothetical protein [Paenibacillus sp. FSL L8-0158]|uniref:hypothetical protein n=1 Tax=Paenibacillus sp. FSL L8-0158 TaxID=2954752 RepID=UPI00315934B9
MLKVHAVTQQGKGSGVLAYERRAHFPAAKSRACHPLGSKIGLQLWHVGRKGSLPQETAVSASGLPHRKERPTHCP